MGGSETTLADSGTAACTLAYDIPPSLHRGEILTAEEQPGGDIRVAGELLGVGDQAPVEHEIRRTLEIRHTGKVPKLNRRTTVERPGRH
jgi:hypothetical protein